MDVLLDTTSTTDDDDDDNNHTTNASSCSSWRDQLIHWCVHRQVRGMQGRPNKAEDTCYSYWIGGTLRLLGGEGGGGGGGCDDLLDQTALRRFVLSCQNAKLGGFSKVYGSYPDILHSFYSMAWLSLSNNQNQNTNNDDDDDDDDEENKQGRREQQLPLHALNCTLGIRQERAAVFFGEYDIP
jgi:prenyltransferase beta subunit